MGLWKSPWPKYRVNCFDIWLIKFIKYDDFCYRASVLKIWAIFHGSFWERCFRQIAFINGEKWTLSNIVKLYIIGMLKKKKKDTHTDWKMQNSLCLILYQYLRRIHCAIDSFCKSYLFTQNKTQNYGSSHWEVLWKIGVLWEF